MTTHRTFRITHYYDRHNHDAFVEHSSGQVDGRRVALYCWFKAAEWFGDSALVSNAGIAAAMVDLYGFKHREATPYHATVDLYSDAEEFDAIDDLMADASLHRDRLREALAPHVTA